MLRRGVSRKRELGSDTKTGVSRAATGKTEKIEVENGNHPGHVARVDADRYEAMKRAFLKILPKKSPGLTVAEIQERVIATRGAVSGRREGRVVGEDRAA